MQNDFDQDLLSYFTDVEHLREVFKASVTAPQLVKRLLIIHGVGGVGKSSLLRMFRLHCKDVNVPVAFVSGDETKSAIDVMSNWADDLKENKVSLPSFSKLLSKYRSILAKVDKQSQKAQGSRGRMTNLAEKAASKSAEVAGGALTGALIGTVVPGVGTAIGSALGGVLAGAGAEALTEWLGGFLKQPDIDLLLDPTQRCSERFRADLKRAAGKQRIVLILDTYEQMALLDDWVRIMAQQLYPNVLLVIAGRSLPDWDRAWESWRTNAQIEELQPMTDEVMSNLVHRYYAKMRGGAPRNDQVEAIIRFARGLPMVVTSAVQLWVDYEYDTEDFQSIKPRVVADLVDRLMEGVPQALIPALEAAAVVRWFDQPILRAVMQEPDIRGIYDELRRFPFIRFRSEGFALHDAVREIIDENLQVQDAERHSQLHTRAATYFESQMESTARADIERLELERLYHRFRADEKAGLALFQKTAKELGEYQFVNRLRTLMNDVKTYPVKNQDACHWIDYYMAYLLDLEGRWLPAEEVFSQIAQDPNASDQVRSYALGRWGKYLARPERISKPGGIEKAIKVLQSGANLSSGYDTSTILIAWELGLLHQRQCQWDQTWQYMKEIKQYALSLGKTYQAAFLLHLIMDPYAKTGNWRGLLDIRNEVSTVLGGLPVSQKLKATLLCNWAVGLSWMGRYVESEEVIRDALKPSSMINLDASGFRRDLGVSLAYQDRFEEANLEFQAAIDEGKEWATRRANFDLERVTLLNYSFWGIGHLRAGELREARRKLMLAVWLKRKHKDLIGFPELYTGLGMVYELQEENLNAQKWYSRCIELNQTARYYFICGAHAGLVRVKYTLGEFLAIPPLLDEAEQLAQEQEYNDHLASLRLTQGQMVWDGHIPEWGNGFGAALHCYQHALIYALRYNRFLLDEVLSGRPQGTPMCPIIPHCMERGEEGVQMLTTIRDWWQTGTNDIGTPRPDTISPIPEGIPLLEAERLARQREPGDGSPQKSVVEQIEAALPAQ